jgi:hypothetical protein
MRVRIFEVRLLAAGLTGLWTLAAVLVLLAYRPGGPVDELVGATATLPIAIGLAALRWPPVARSPRWFAGIVWLGLATALVLVPSIVEVGRQLVAGGPQTLLPSPEAAYPWVLALAGTSLLAGLGIARRILGEQAPRTLRLGRGALLGLAMTAVSGSLFAGAAVANELGLRDRASVASRFGPTHPSTKPPACNGDIRAGQTAAIGLSLDATVDGRSLGSVQLTGSRAGDDVRWTADVATDRSLGRFGFAQIGSQAWSKMPGSAWQVIPAARAEGRTVDRQLLLVALAPGNRVAAEEHGLEYVEGAPARHCRAALDGSTLLAALPQVAWFAPQPDLHRWRGQLDYWVFADGELGRVDGTISGEASGLDLAGLQATITIVMTATDRDQVMTIAPPAR